MARFLISFCLLIYMLVFHTRFFLVNTAIILGGLFILAKVCAVLLRIFPEFLDYRAPAQAVIPPPREVHRCEGALAHFENNPEKILGQSLQTIVDIVGDFDSYGDFDHGIAEYSWGDDTISVTCWFKSGYCDEIHINRRVGRFGDMEKIAVYKRRQEAIDELEAGKDEKFANVDDLMADLRADD
jgi:hypothetical protein